jgi:excisionase family DNA binding protein
MLPPNTVTKGEAAMLTVSELAGKLKICPAAVYELCKHKKIPLVRIGYGRGVIRFREEDIDDFLGGATVKPETPSPPKPPPVRLKHLKV